MHLSYLNYIIFTTIYKCNENVIKYIMIMYIYLFNKENSWYTSKWCEEGFMIMIVMLQICIFI